MLTRTNDEFDILFFLNLGLLVLVIIAIGYVESNGCPVSESIKPCVCAKVLGINSWDIKCGGHSDIDLVNIFQTLEKNLTKTEKHFNRFYLNNTFITELKENTFKDITFDDIIIENCTNLSKIHVNAFNQTDLVTKYLYISGSFKLSSSDNSIFEVISKFVNLEELQLENNNITEIPSNIFNNQDELEFLTFKGKSIKKLGPRAFSSLHRLKSIEISYTSIEYIPEYAFEFDQESNQTIAIRFEGNHLLNGSSIHKNSLKNIKRPLYLALDSHIEYLEENIFKPLLSENPKNKIQMDYVKFDCNNCKNNWLRKPSNLLGRFYNLQCSNNKNFNDPDNFAECKPYQSLEPCKFERPNTEQQLLYCGGNTDIDLKAIFHNLSKQLSDNEKHFTYFYLRNTYINVLEENTFKDITFDEIEISGCDNLTNIERYAFNTTDLVTKKIWLKENINLYLDETFYDILSSFVNVEFIYLNDIGFNEIPSKAFRPLNGYQNNLKTLLLDQDLTKIGSYAFSNLKNLTTLSLKCNSLNSIQDYAFEFEGYSDKQLEIDFRYNWNFSIFNETTFRNIRRPTELQIWDRLNGYYLEEKVFLPFLLENEENSIKLTNVEVFDCNDCRNYWIKYNRNITQRVTANCSNKKQLIDPDNFKNCTL